ncbi:hypothetical protein PTUN_a4015 [Pseudoalteromonas tunicata]|uniref:Uncharacterized protein n=1 Tax=Pseudoalteromonas tunicata D2 TaxID=87626 RepID=A4CF41_9GAMM|nr:hypothetical protein PTUN_a4015 [Pseudoalteromonas tunicata]EAR26589.1 hypothetical protein PTD2_00232 [Pseudoalteromonas tunicata D2]
MLEVMVLFIYLLIFALFGMTATYFVRFFYSFWWQKKIEPKWLIRATICVVLIALCAVLVEFML